MTKKIQGHEAQFTRAIKSEGRIHSARPSGRRASQQSSQQVACDGRVGQSIERDDLWLGSNQRATSSWLAQELSRVSAGKWSRK